MLLKTSFMVLEFGYLALEKFWNSFGNIVKGVCRNPDYSLQHIFSECNQVVERARENCPRFSRLKGPHKVKPAAIFQS